METILLAVFGLGAVLFFMNEWNRAYDAANKYREPKETPYSPVIKEEKRYLQDRYREWKKRDN